ncbi:amino acid ABC transporter permease [Lactobacillus sp. ESL0731]|uniref:amino acid ABC transporter permease n=1 Tax=unclassified Lactobacillus TaxID=2620435 RepID=UPI0023F8B178|nr:MULTISPECIES: amino acid ABC transporter permease [unclassified Lactobacillus]WEV50563.1 amino acid ABC transporter permease [Lactobacillus sp. ESL0700]WEV61693.1 amino acid ABC transporter permease [Lactobacillus sp. ESL0731]
MINIFTHFGNQLLVGLGWTLLCSLITLVFSLIIGTSLALLQMLPSKLVHFLCRVYIEVFRNIPLLVIVMFFYLIIPLYFFKINGFTAGTIGLTLYTSAFIAEIIRSGIQSVEAGQLEGSRSTGMTYWQAMRYVVLPQAFKIVIPSLGNQFVNLIKDSSILAFVAGFDLLYQANAIASTTFDTINSYLVVGILYLLLTMPLSYYMHYLEKKLS